jgi:hypothetical protein
MLKLLIVGSLALGLSQSPAWATPSGQWTDRDGNIHADTVTAHAVVAGIQDALESRYQVTAYVTDAWEVAGAPGKQLFCGSFTAQGRARHFIASLDGAAFSAGEVDRGVFVASSCRLPYPGILIGAERPVMEIERVHAAR